MEDEQSKEKDNPKMHRDQDKKTPIRCQISYKTKLLGGEEKELEKDFDSLMKECIREEKELTPTLSEEQRRLIETLPEMSMPDEKLKELCRPWKDALIITLIGGNKLEDDEG
ncbi:hypothetical protein K1719_034313 [Acacia pycnantha]|nr:hypothetical protein K1719_034313 [Acacia pycnantha]